MSRLAMVMQGTGDPGLFDFIKKLGGQAIKSFVPGGSLALTAASALSRSGALAGTGGIRPSPPRLLSGPMVQTPTGPVTIPSALRTVFPGAAAITRLAGGLTRLAPSAGGRNIPAGSFRRAGLMPGIGRRRRRMNPCNFRALTRGIRRMKAFSKLAKQVLKSESRFKSPRKGARGFGGRRKKR